MTSPPAAPDFSRLRSRPERLRDAGAWLLFGLALGFVVAMVVYAQSVGGAWAGLAVASSSIAGAVAAYARARVRSRRVELEAKAAAQHDGLTGLFNRRALDSVGEQLFNASQQMSQPISALLLDIDHFKRINDLYGHAAGDEVLRHFAKVISQPVRTNDLVARYGGEEFAIILSGSPLAPAVRLAERIRASVEEDIFPTKSSVEDGKSLKVTSSIGVATVFPGTGSTFRELIDRADANLYRAKRAGRNRVMVDALGPVEH